MDPNTGKSFARARWAVCNYEDDSCSVQDVYAAVSVSVKTFMALTTIKDLEYYQFDFKTGFPNSYNTGRQYGSN